MPLPLRRLRRPEPAPRRNRERLIQTPSPEQVPVAAEEEFPEPGAEGKPGMAPAAAPSIRKLARDLGIDLTRVRGSARGGRIVLEDVRAYIQKLQRLAAAPRAAAAAGAPAPRPAPEQIDFSQWGPIIEEAPLPPPRGHRPPDGGKLDHHSARHPIRRGRHYRLDGACGRNMPPPTSKRARGSP